jgi:dTDP-4-amino-4,6-dideoxygalactose transaminase
MKRIPFSRPDLGEEEIAEVVDTLRSGWLTTGPRTQKFEEEFARMVGVPHALATSSCTAALHLALLGRGVKPGDEVITSTMTFAATANVIVHCGATPVLADVDADTLNIDPDDVAARITPRTRAVMAVHYAGRPCAMDALVRLCRARGLILIEDAAHAVGASLDGRAAGSLGDAAGFSFYANKNLTTGEGGMLTTSSAEVFERARVLRLQGMTRDVFRRGDAGASAQSWRYEVVAAGFKYAMSDVQAAIGLHQLRRFPAMQQRRSAIAARYTAELAGVPGLGTPPPVDAGSVHAWHLYVVRVKSEARLTRDQLFTALAEQGIDCSVHFLPLHLHPYFQESWGTRPGMFPRAETGFGEVLSLPLFPALSDSDQARVIGAVKKALEAS